MLGSSESRHAPDIKKQPIYPRSFSTQTMLVKMSARKKCLNRTRPNGEISMLYKVFLIKRSSVLNRYLNGLNIRIKKVMSTPIVKPAIALSKIFDIFIMKAWQTRQKVQIPKRIVPIYNKRLRCHIFTLYNFMYVTLCLISISKIETQLIRYLRSTWRTTPHAAIIKMNINSKRNVYIDE